MNITNFIGGGWKEMLGKKCDCVNGLVVVPNGEDDIDKNICEKCDGTGIIEIMGGSDSDEWGVIDTARCDCQY